MKINIAFASDNNYAQHLCVAIYSLLNSSNKNNFYEIYVLDGGISKSNKKNIDYSINKFKNKKIHYVKIDKKTFINAKQFLHLNQTAYYRLLLANVFKNLKKLIYLDCDILIFDDICELFTKNIDDYSAAAVKIFHPNYQRTIERFFGFKKLSFCFNSGVMIFNLSKIRELNLTKEFKKVFDEKNGNFIAADQDILNIVLNKKTKKLSNKWNVTSYIFYTKNETYCKLNKKEFLNLKTNPAIIHFDGAKPWSYGNTHPYRKKYFEILKETTYADFKPKFNISEFSNNFFFFIGTSFVNLLPKKLYDILVSLYLKNNFLEKRLHEVENKKSKITFHS